MRRSCKAVLTTTLFWVLTSFGQRSFSAQGQEMYSQPSHVCHRISIPMCQDVPYNATRMPNLLKHKTQEEAATTAHEFLPLVDLDCSPHARFFICSVFAPMCTPQINFGVTSCRSVCISVKNACMPILERLNFTWPPFLHCDSFAEGGLCMLPPDVKQKQPGEFLPPHNTMTLDRGINKDLVTPEWKKKHEGGFSSSDINTVPRSPPAAPRRNYNLSSIHDDNSKEARDMLHYRSRHICGNGRLLVHENEKDGGEICVPFCGGNFLYQSSEKKLAVIWSAVWAFACVASTLFSVLTFCLESNRFQYPERPVIFMAFSYMLYSIPFIMRVFVDSSSMCDMNSVSKEELLSSSASSSISGNCMASFLLQYYFGFAADIWWSILTFCWFMSASKYWSPEALHTYSTFFHFIAWGAPTIGCILVFTFKQVDGDELTGLCYVGNLDSKALLYHVILPRAILLTAGTVFILLGLVSLVRIRNSIKRESLISSSVSTCMISASEGHIHNHISSNDLAKHVSKLERLMIRLGVFSGLATVPAIFVLGFRIHTFMNYDQWVLRASGLKMNLCHFRLENEESCSTSRMILPLFRIFMSLIVGVTSGIWVWSPKTILVWKRSFRTLCDLKSSFSKPTQSTIATVQLLYPCDTTVGTSSLSRNTRSGDWAPPPTLDTSTARASFTSSGVHYCQRNSESSYV